MAMDDPARPVTPEERQAAISQLRRAAEDGRLAAPELDARIVQVQQARLNAQLSAALGGLQQTGGSWPVAAAPAPPPTPASSPPVPTPPVPRAPGYGPKDRLTLSAGMSNEKREGAWTVPPFLRIQAALGNVKLDCRKATAATEVVDIEIGVGAGTIVIIVPDGWAANTDRLGKGMGTIKMSVPHQPQPGSPVLVFHGQLGVGTLKVRGPNWLERKLAKDDAG